MAVNYTMADAVKIIAEGKDMAAITDIAKRFPNFAIVAAKACAGANPDFVVALCSAVPEYVTARKAENAFKDGSEDAGDEEAPKADPKPTPAPAKAQKASESAEEAPKKRRGRPRKNPAPEPAPAPETTPFDEDGPAVDDEPTEDLGKYAGMKAPELYKELKSRGIKAKPRQDAAVYAQLLLDDDAKAKEADDAWGDDDEDDWDI